MTREDALDFIQPISLFGQRPQTWLDLGCGSGTFTNALASLLPMGSIIFAVDKDVFPMRQSMSGVKIEFLLQDFSMENFELPNADVIFMANAFHFVHQKSKWVDQIEKVFRNDPHWVIAEYDSDISNRWVPYPISFSGLTQFFREKNYGTVRKLNERPSIYDSKGIYLAEIKK